MFTKGKKYDLWVSGQGIDITTSVAGFIPFFSLLDSAGTRIAGFRKVNSDTASVVAGTVLDVASFSPIGSAAKGAAKLGNMALNFANLGGSADYKVEEAIYNHFDHDIWISDSRDTVDAKFNYAKDQMMALVQSGDIEIKKAGDYFGEGAFSSYSKSVGWTTRQFDPLTGQYKTFYQNDYYFFKAGGGSCYTSSSGEGQISDIENNIREGALSGESSKPSRETSKPNAIFDSGIRPQHNLSGHGDTPDARVSPSKPIPSRIPGGPK